MQFGSGLIERSDGAEVKALLLVALRDGESREEGKNGVMEQWRIGGLPWGLSGGVRVRQRGGEELLQRGAGLMAGPIALLLPVGLPSVDGRWNDVVARRCVVRSPAFRRKRGSRRGLGGLSSLPPEGGTTNRVAADVSEDLLEFFRGLRLAQGVEVGLVGRVLGPHLGEDRARGFEGAEIAGEGLVCVAGFRRGAGQLEPLCSCRDVSQKVE